MAKNVNTTNETVGEAVSRTEVFFKKNGKLIGYIGAGLVVVAAIIVLIIQFYSKPLKDEAVGQTFTAEQYFRAEDYDKALNGDGNSLGFIQIIDEYGAKAGKAVYLYAGICELQLGNAPEAISYLTKYNGRPQVLSPGLSGGGQYLRRHIPPQGRHHLRGTRPQRRGTGPLPRHQGQIPPDLRGIRDRQIHHTHRS